MLLGSNELFYCTHLPFLSAMLLQMTINMVKKGDCVDTLWLNYKVTFIGLFTKICRKIVWPFVYTTKGTIHTITIHKPLEASPLLHIKTTQHLNRYHLIRVAVQIEKSNRENKSSLTMCICFSCTCSKLVYCLQLFFTSVIHSLTYSLLLYFSNSYYFIDAKFCDYFLICYNSLS
jgi:hypothetical protein